MKKILLIPTIAALTATPIMTLSSCVVDVGGGGGDKPEPTPPSPEGTYTFTFHGTNCTINEQQDYADKVDVNETNVIYTVIPKANYVCDIPTHVEGVTFKIEGNRLIVTIAKMDNNYSVNVSAHYVEPTPTTYEFKFTGNHCTINNKDKFTDNVIVGKENVQYTVIPEEGYQLEDQTIQEGVTIKDNILTIAKMNQAYDVTVDAKKIPDTKDYFTIESADGEEVSFYCNQESNDGKHKIDLEYLLDGEEEWKDYDITCTDDDESILEWVKIPAGRKVMIRGDNPDYFSFDNGITYWKTSFGFSNNVKISGNSMSLIYKDKYDGKSPLNSEGCFYGLFNTCFEDYRNVEDASKFLLPAKILSNRCYEYMFDGNQSLVYTPTKLPASSLSYNCYAGMFYDCDSLETLPSEMLPANTLSENCYYIMFYDCDSLEGIPDNFLPATRLCSNCYDNMFSSCDSLNNVPFDLLPATRLACLCYNGMFSHCPITKAPYLRADNGHLEYGCYQGMFSECHNLTYVEVNFGLSYDYWPEGCTNGWLDNMYPPSGRFIWQGTTTVSWSRDGSHVPSNWTIENPEP